MQKTVGVERVPIETQEGSVATAAVATPPQPNFAGSTSQAVISSGSEVKGFLSDPAYSGFATWSGTLLSVVAAAVAWRQARKAKSMIAKVHDEQHRHYAESTRKCLDRMYHNLKPLINNTVPPRGVKVPLALELAKHECHEALSLPLNGNLAPIKVSIENIQLYLDQYSGAQNLTELNSRIRSEIQNALGLCAQNIDLLAVSAS